MRHRNCRRRLHHRRFCAMRGAALRLRAWRVAPASRVQPRAASRVNRTATSRHCRCCRPRCRIAPASQTGAGGVELCRHSDAHSLFSIDAAGGWIRHCDLAARRARSYALTMPSRKQRAQGKPGAHDTRSRAQKCTRRTAGAPEHPAFPAQWFFGLCRALPGDEFLLPPSLTDWRLIEGPVGPDNLHQLDTSNGCQDHTVLPSAASSSHPPRPARMLPEEVSTEAFKRRSSVRRPIAHG